MRLPRLTIALIPVLLGGSVAPAHAQTDLSGIWAPIFHEDQPERIPGPEIGDYLGLPITEAARMRAETWDASLLTIPEHQCKPHPSTYGFRGVGNLRIWNVVNDDTQQLVSIRTHIQWQEQEREVFMDNRAAPPDFAAHTWQGFSRGHWEGNALVVETDHLKAGWIRRNGLPLSDRAHMTERFIRHGDILTHVYIIEDPVYLSEPLVKTNGFQLTATLTMAPYPCESVIEVPREEGAVPHNLPGQNSFWDDFAKKHNLPIDATRGGAETALPEFGKQLRPRQTGGAR